MTREISVWWLNLLRAGYLVLVVGLAFSVWPEILDTIQMPELQHGVINSLLGAIGLLAVLGLRYQLQMLPLLLFEMTWKAIWLIRIRLPRWYFHSFDAAGAAMANAIVMVVIFPFVVP